MCVHFLERGEKLVWFWFGFVTKFREDIDSFMTDLCACTIYSIA